MATTFEKAQNLLLQSPLKKPFTKWIVDFFASQKTHLLFASKQDILLPLLPYLKNSSFTSICPLSGLDAYKLAKAYAQSKGFGLFITDEKDELYLPIEEENKAPLLVLVLEKSKKQKEDLKKSLEEDFVLFYSSLTKAFKEKKSVKVRLPVDFLYEQKEISFPSTNISFNPYLLSQALFFSKQILLSSVNPLIVIGERIDSEESYTALLQFAETFKIPLSTTKDAKGVICERHPLFIGIEEEPIQNFPCDCLIAIGGKDKYHFMEKSSLFASSSTIRANNRSFSFLPLHTYLRSLCKISWNLPSVFLKASSKNLENHKKSTFLDHKSLKQKTSFSNTQIAIRSSFAKKLPIKKEHILSLLSEYLTDAQLLTPSSLLEPIALKIPVEKDCYCPPSNCSFQAMGMALARAHKRLLFLLDETAIKTALYKLKISQILGFNPIFLILHSKDLANWQTCLLSQKVEDACALKDVFKSALQDTTKTFWIECKVNDLSLSDLKDRKPNKGSC